MHLRLDVHVLGRVPVGGRRRDEPRRRGPGEAAVALVGPLHRRANRQPPLLRRVLAHADLLAVEQHGRAGQREEQAVDQADAARIPVEHRRQPPHDPAAVDAHPLLGRERLEDLLALRVGELVERELVVVAHEVRPLRLGLEHGALRERLRERTCVLPGEREVERLHAEEVELHGELGRVARAAEELELLVVREVHLAEQHGLARSALQEPAEVAEDLVRVADVDALRRLDEERHRIDPESRDAELQPEADRLRDLVAHGGVRDVQVGLVPVEAVQVVLAGALVELPDAVLLAGEHRRRLLLRRFVTPHVPVAVRRRAAPPGRLEPRMPLRRVVHHEVDDHPHAARPAPCA